MIISKILKKIFIIFLSVLTISICQSQSASCNQLHTIQRKQKAAHEKVKRLRILEHLEKNKLYKNQQRLESASANLESSKVQYSNLESQLSRMEVDLTKAINEYNQANVDMKNSIRQVFKNQRTGMFDLTFSAQDLNSLLDVVYFEKIVLKKDYARMVAIKVKSERIAKMKKDIQARKVELAQSIKSINSQKVYIKNAIAQNQSMINKYKTDRATYERAERELARQSASIQSMINRNRGSSTVKITSTGFMKPIGGRITSPFGWRTHPIFNSRTFHSGVDIAGPNMGSIRASNSGKVIYAGWYGGYGKVVILDHGSVNGRPITTLYAHMSSIRARQGQFVQKGEVVGYEGSTGYSTGPHCHFEVRVNGKPNNPLNYI